MGRTEKRTRKNKYASKAPPLDPFEQTVAASQQYDIQKQLDKDRRRRGKWAIEDEEEDNEEEEDEYFSSEDDEYDAEAEAAEEAAFEAEEEARWRAADGADSPTSVGPDQRGSGLNGRDGRKKSESGRVRMGTGGEATPGKTSRGSRRRRVYPDESQIDPYDPATFGFALVGRVIGAHGLHGEVKVQVFTDFAAERLQPRGEVHVKPPSRRFPKPTRVIASRPIGSDSSSSSKAGRKSDGGLPPPAQQQKKQQAELWLVRLKGVGTREEASVLRSHEIFVWKEDRTQTLESDEYLIEDLVGLPVFRQPQQQQQQTDAPLAPPTSTHVRASNEKEEEGEESAEANPFEGVASLQEFLGTVVGVVTKDEVAPGGGGRSLGHDLLEVELPRHHRGRRLNGDIDDDDDGDSGTSEEAHQERGQRVDHEEEEEDTPKRYLISALAPPPVLSCLVPLVPSIVTKIQLRTTTGEFFSASLSSASAPTSSPLETTTEWAGEGFVLVDPPDGLFEATTAEQRTVKKRIRALLPPLAAAWMELEEERRKRRREAATSK